MRLIVKERPKYRLTLASNGRMRLNVNTAFKGSVDYEHYEGPYTIEPKVTSQTMATDDLLMDDDVTINAIHYSAVSNPQGGLTVQIGEI